jgi:hypothetical protein
MLLSSLLKVGPHRFSFITACATRLQRIFVPDEIKFTESISIAAFVTQITLYDVVITTTISWIACDICEDKHI